MIWICVYKWRQRNWILYGCVFIGCVYKWTQKNRFDFFKSTRFKLKPSDLHQTANYAWMPECSVFSCKESESSDNLRLTNWFCRIKLDHTKILRILLVCMNEFCLIWISLILWLFSLGTDKKKGASEAKQSKCVCVIL